MPRSSPVVQGRRDDARAPPGAASDLQLPRLPPRDGARGADHPGGAKVQAGLRAGGECIADLATSRQQPDLFGEVASTPTAWRALDSIPEPLLERLQAARARARASVWAFGMAPKRVTLDFDSTLVEVESENKEQAAPNWKHGFGFHPLLVYLDQTGEALAGQLRPGNAGANTAQDHVELLDAALQQLPWPTRAEDPELGPRVLVRSDSAGASHGFVGAIAERWLEFSVGFDVAEPVGEAILQLPERSWVVAIAKELEERGSRGGRDLRAPRPLAVAPGVPCLGAPGGAPSRCQLQPLRS